MKLVEVKWVDADNEAGWVEYDNKEYQKVEPTVSYGLLVDAGENFTVISTCYNPEAEQWINLHRIPNGMILGVRIIEEV